MSLRILIRRLRALFADPQLEEEIATHISLQAAEYERRGMSPEEAHRAALRQFGGVTQIRETYRAQHRLPLFDGFVQDLAYAWRQLRKSPVFAIASVLTLALGIGANTAVFRGVDALMLRSLPVRHANDLVLLQALDFGKPASFNYPIFRDMAAHQQVLEDMVAAGDVWHLRATVTGGVAVKLEDGRLVTGGYFRVLGVDAALGRMLTDEDDRPSAPGVAVIGYKVWDRQFGHSADVIGKVLTINSVPVTIVGVAPRRFQGERLLFTPDLWLPMSMQPSLAGADWLKANFNFLDVLVNLRPGVSMAQAQAALDPLYRRLVAQHTGETRGSGQDRLVVVSGRRGITISEIQDVLVEPLRVLMWMVAAVLAIACCNLANLLLARGAARAHEIGVRLALGAGRARLVRQLLTESLLLSGLGALLGFAVAQWGTNMLVAWVADENLDIGSALDWHVLGFLAAVSIAATCLFGVMPALAGTRLNIRSALQANWRTASQGRPRQLLGKAFVVAQVSICLMLLAGAALLARSLANLERQDWGFRPEGLILADLQIDVTRDLTPQGAKPLTTLRQPLYEKMNAIPGVRSAALAYGGPLANSSWSSDISISGRPARASDYAQVVRVSPRYFETMGIQIAAGPALGEADREKSPRVVVLSQTAARRIFDGADPIGRYISFETNFKTSDAQQVVGVAHDLRIASPREDPGVVVFAPLAQPVAALAEQAMPFSSVVLRTDRDPVALAETVRKVLQEAAPDRALGSIRPASEILDDQLATEQAMAALSAGLGVLAMVLAAAGLYGVISYAMTRRTQEMGIRLALGASGTQVTRLVMREVGLLVSGGIVAGAALSVACVRLVRSLLYGITPWDFKWLALAGLLLVVVAAAAGYLPARRAARLDPLEALRQE